MFGSYRIDDERPGKTPRLTLGFRNGTIHLYSCSVQILNEPLDSLYDWGVNLMSEEWNENRVRSLLAKKLDLLLCDVLLEQASFAGAGNIIKNEVLFNLKLHPEERLADISPRMRTKLSNRSRSGE